jgi:peptidoglycan/xylan/chitin deacetylase (PgdA/CDA1 family)
MLICVNYHYIRKSFDAKYPSIFGITPDAFEHQILELSKLGKFISADYLAYVIESGRVLDGLYFLITFDDGLKEQMNLAVPILDRLGIPAVFFANSATFTESRVEYVHKIHLIRSVVDPKELSNLVKVELPLLGKLEMKAIRAKGVEHYKYDTPDTAELKYLLNFILKKEQLDILIDKTFESFFSEPEVNDTLYMSVGDITYLAKRGMLGSHGHTHVPMGLQTAEHKLREIVGSGERLKELTGCFPKAFSFPYGSLNSVLGCKDYLTKGGYQFALTMERAINQDLKQPFGLSRFDNNDMPLGKSFQFQHNNELDKYPLRSWKIQN